MLRNFFLLFIIFFFQSGNLYATDTVIFSSYDNGPSTSTTQYNSPSGSSIAWGTVAARFLQIVPEAGNFSNFRVAIINQPTAAAQFVFTVQLAAAATPTTINSTSVTCTIAGTDTACSDLSNSFAVAAGDLILIQSVPSSSPAVAGTTKISLKFASNTDGNTILTSYISINSSTTATEYFQLSGADNTYSTTASDPTVETLMPVAGTIKNLYASTISAPGVGASRSYTVQLNGTNQALTCTITGTELACSDTNSADGFAVVEGDDVVVTMVPTASPTASRQRAAAVLVPTTANQFASPVNFSAILDNTQTTYMKFSSGDSRVITTEATQQHISEAMLVTKILATVATAPGANTSWVFTLRNNTADTAITCTIKDANTSCSGTGTIVVDAGDLLDTSVATSGTAATGTGRIAYQCKRFRRVMLTP